MAINTVVSNCSGIAVQEAFERIVKNHLPNEAWLGERNFYKKKTRERMNSATPTSLKKLQNQEYIASSVIIHSTDGWNYLSRSIDSLLNGDTASSIHFAYYAELRAVMSILGYEGIGVFDRKHVYYDSNKDPHLFSNFTTHSLADQGISAWAGLSSKKNVLFDLVKVKNRSLDKWITESGVSTRSAFTSSLIGKWLKQWSIDLHLKQDQDIRNVMSYRPHYENPSVDINNVISNLQEIWSLLEPTSTSGFADLDQHLLRIALEEIYRRSTSRQPIGSDYEIFVKRIFDRLGEDSTGQLFKFLVRLRSPLDAKIFIEAKKDAHRSEVNKQDPFPIICRAILLLRLSSGAAQNLIENSSVNKDDLRFWWEDYCKTNGIIDSLPSGIDPADLFVDIRDALSAFSFPTSYSSIKMAHDSDSESLFYLKQFQRPSIWGMGL